MAKALITRPDGTTVAVEGTPQEIAEVVQTVEARTGIREAKVKGSKGAPSKARDSLADLLASLIDGGFFKSPRDLGSVKAKLAEMGHVYPVTTLSPMMLRVVRKKYLRRIKQNSRWFYTG